MPDVSAAFDTAPWHELYVMAGGAAGALTGLLFVAVSINLERILSIGWLPRRAAETLVLMVGLLILSLLVLVPPVIPRSRIRDAGSGRDRAADSCDEAMVASQSAAGAQTQGGTRPRPGVVRIAGLGRRDQPHRQKWGRPLLVRAGGDLRLRRCGRERVGSAGGNPSIGPGGGCSSRGLICQARKVFCGPHPPSSVHIRAVPRPPSGPSPDGVGRRMGCGCTAPR
jgi:hypothetical protein